MNTRFGLNVEKVRPKPRAEEATVEEQLMAELKDRLPGDACCFCVPDSGGAPDGAPRIVICHQGRALGIQLRQGRISAVQAAGFTRLRAAGMRIEVARDTREALALIAEMGVVLKDKVNSPFAARDFFRQETRRRV
jgi:hypothetical protein